MLILAFLKESPDGQWVEENILMNDRENVTLVTYVSCFLHTHYELRSCYLSYVQNYI